MIEDAFAWKEELAKVADRLEVKTKQTRWTARTGYLIERDFAVSAYAIRKLIESHEVSDEFGQRQFPVTRFEVRGNAPDFEHGRRRTLSIVDLCHEIVHSSVFAFCCGETPDLFDGIYVSSGRQQNRHVYLVLASDYIALCGDIGADEGANERPHPGWHG